MFNYFAVAFLLRDIDAKSSQHTEAFRGNRSGINHGGLVSWGCCDNVPHLSGLSNRNILSQLWKLDVWDQGFSGVGSSSSLPVPGLCQQSWAFWGEHVSRGCGVLFRSCHQQKKKCRPTATHDVGALPGRAVRSPLSMKSRG